MAQLSIIQHKDIKEASRFDAEYFKPFNIKAKKLIMSRKFSLLKDVGKFIIGPFGSTVKVEDYVDDKSYKYIRGRDIKNGFINSDDNASISKEKYLSLPKYHLQDGDILITVVGTLGNIAIYRNHFGPAMFSCKSTVLRPVTINSEFLMIFFSTKYGKSLLMKNERGAIQKGFNLPDLKNIPMPDFDNNFYDEILEDVKKISKKRAHSKQFYQESEQLLLQELGLVNYKQKRTLTYGTTKKEVRKAKRFDAEYFQPKYAEIIKRIEDYDSGFDVVGNQFDLISGRTPEKYFNDEKEIQVLKTKQIRNEALNYDDVVYSESEFVENILQEKDVLFASMGVGSLGRTGIFYNFETNKKTSVDSTVKIFRKIKNIEAEVLQTFFNLIIGQEYIYRYIVGSTGIISIKNNSLLNLKIPLIKTEIQKQIVEKIQKSHKLRKESKELLEEAKSKVEKKIENF